MVSARTSVLRDGLSLSIGQAATQVCSFVRSIILARLISPENFGIAATFAITFSFLEMVSNVSSDKLLIQSKDGNEPRLQSTAQFFHVTRGIVNASIIFLLAKPISALFGVPQARWAFECLAVVPFIRSFVHLDTNRFQRDMRFGPSIQLDVVSSVIVTAIAFPLGWWLRDYSAMLWILIVQAVVSTVGSHLFSERKYAICWDRGFARKIARFGWPLLINGLLMFGIFEGDRFTIGSASRLFPQSIYTLGDLGVYSVAFSLTMAPTMFVANVFTSLFLPLLSRVQGIQPQFFGRYLACAQVVSLIAAAISIPFIIVGGKLVTLIYGPKYAAAATFIGWLAIMWAIRIFRVTPTLGAISLGDTANAMLSNILRSLAVFGVLLSAASGASLVWICISGVAGECLATLVSMFRLRYRFGLPLSLSVKPLVVLAAGMLAAGLVSGYAGQSWAAAISCSVLLVGVTSGTMLLCYPKLRQDFVSLLFRSTDRIGDFQKGSVAG